MSLESNCLTASFAHPELPGNFLLQIKKLNVFNDWNDNDADNHVNHFEVTLIEEKPSTIELAATLELYTNKGFVVVGESNPALDLSVQKRFKSDETYVECYLDKSKNKRKPNPMNMERDPVHTSPWTFGAIPQTHILPESFTKYFPNFLGNEPSIGGTATTVTLRLTIFLPGKLTSAPEKQETPNHFSLGSLLTNPKYSDITIKCGGETFKAHRAVLSAR